MYVLDTNIVSELRRRRPHGGVRAWIDSVGGASLHLAAITAGEIQSGIEITRKQDQKRAEEIEFWLDELLLSISVLDAGAPIFRQWAKLMVGQQDHLIEDALIAATAIHHNMTVVTRNVADFARFNVKVLNPFDYVP
jgi:predicted nucleic acid-binding protein